MKNLTKKLAYHDKNIESINSKLKKFEFLCTKSIE